MMPCMAASTIGERIAHARGWLGISQEELAERVGVSRDTISKWETNVFRPRRSRIGKLEKALGVDLRDRPPPVSDRVQAMIDGLTSEQREYLLEQLTGHPPPPRPEPPSQGEAGRPRRAG